MKKKKITPFFISIAIIFVILYIFLATRPLSEEYHFSPDWKINISNPSVSEISPEDSLIYFKLGQNLGYFTKDGQLALNRTYPAKAAISNSYFALYNSEAENIPFYDNKGIQKGKINTYGFPYFVDDRIFVFLPGGGSFSFCNSDGNVCWTCESTLPITAFSSNNNYTAVGYADGSIKVFENTTGDVEINFAPGGSDYPIMYGLDISPNGEYVASISGLNRQRFVLAHKEDNQPKIVFHIFLDSDQNRRTFVKFSSDGERVFYNYKNSLGIYDLKKQKNYSYPINSKILSLEEADNLYFLLGKADNEYTVYIIEKTNILEGSFSFEAKSAFIKTSENILFVGKDDSISRLSLTKE